MPFMLTELHRLIINDITNNTLLETYCIYDNTQPDLSKHLEHFFWWVWLTFHEQAFQNGMVINQCP